MNSRHGLAVSLSSALLLAGCASAPTAPTAPAAPAAPAAPNGAPAADVDPTIRDPFESSNRAIFALNERIDRQILEPIAKGWNFVVPDPAQAAIQRFFVNLNSPVVFVNDLLQAKPIAAAQDVGRFVLNSTAGLAGLFDPATQVGLPSHDEDFGQTLGVWGVPSGPYWVLPLLGPSNPRDTGGLLVDYGMTAYTFYFPWYVNFDLFGVRLVNRRAQLLETIREERESAFDFYVAVRNAYVQRRDEQIGDRKPKSEESNDDLYELDPLDETQ